jgi:hypothetical protein
VIDPINPRVETAEEVRDRVLEAAEYIPLRQLGTTDDCGFHHSRRYFNLARNGFQKSARVAGTALAAKRSAFDMIVLFANYANFAVDIVQGECYFYRVSLSFEEIGE